MRSIIADRVLYPASPFAADPCWSCFRPGQAGMAATTDPRVAGGDLVRVCTGCHLALAGGRAADRPWPSREDLPGLLVEWARWDFNGEVDEEFVARMLRALVAGLEREARVCWWECLKGALLKVQAHDEFGFELLSVAPEERDPEALAKGAAEEVDAVLAKLIGGAR